MKKILSLTMLLFFFCSSAFALTSSLGIRTSVKHAMGSEYYTISNSTYQKDFIVNALGCSIFGSTYAGTTKGFGIGYSIGFLKPLTAEDKDDQYNLRNLPLAWEGTLLSQYKYPVNERCNIEFGIGIRTEIIEGSGIVGTKEVELHYQEYDLLIGASLAYHIHTNFNLILGLNSTVFTYHFVNDATKVIQPIDNPSYRISLIPSIGISYIF